MTHAKTGVKAALLVRGMRPVDGKVPETPANQPIGNAASAGRRTTS